MVTVTELTTLTNPEYLFEFTEEQIDSVQVDLDALLEPTRDEDKGTDLWTIFNVVQEKILNGDFNYISGVFLQQFFAEPVQSRHKKWALQNPDPRVTLASVVLHS